jgi:ubiquinone biosynthesis protein COQ9
MEKASNLDPRKTKALLALLPAVPFDGWDSAPDDVFPRGGLDAALYFSAWADAEMLKRLKGKNFVQLRTRDKIAQGVWARLDILAPHREAVRASLSTLGRPPRNIHLPKLVWNTADAIWRAAGDTATDYNHYTKRLLLAGVLTSTTLYWLNDDSTGFEKTRAFLDRRIDNVLKLGALIGKIRNGKSVRS